jgi:hypothetical protein
VLHRQANKRQDTSGETLLDVLGLKLDTSRERLIDMVVGLMRVPAVETHDLPCKSLALPCSRVG